MNAERIFFNIFIGFFILFIFNRYMATKRIVLLGVIFGQFFSFILSFISMINNVKANFWVQLLTSVFGIVIPGIIFFYDHFYRGKLNNFVERLSRFREKNKSWVEEEEDEVLLLHDGSEDTLGLSKQVEIISEKHVEELIKGYNCPLDEIPSTVKNGLMEVQRFLKTRSYKKSLETYITIEKRFSDNAVLQFNIGNMYYHLKDYDSAIKRYNKALAINGSSIKSEHKDDERFSYKTAARRIKIILKKIEDYDIAFNIAVCLLAEGKYDQAVDMFKKAGDLKGNWINIYKPLGIIYENLGRCPEALEMYQNLVEFNPENFDIHKKLAEFLCEVGDYRQSKEYYHKAVELKPDFVDGYISLGNQLLNAEKYNEAIEAYEEAVKIDPNQSATYYNLGIALYGIGEKVQALGKYKKAIELNENDYNSYYNLGVILDEMDRKEDAVLAFEHCLDIKPDFYEASNNIAVILCSMEQYDEAKDIYLKALQYYPNNYELYFNLAVTLECQGREDHAEEVYTKIIKMEPKFNDAYFNLALIEFKRGAYEKSQDYLSKVIENNKYYHGAYYHLARVHAVLREYGKCIDNLKKAINLSPDYINKAKNEQIFDCIRNLKGYENIVEANAL